MKVLIIGLGSIANKHIDALYKIDSKVKIYALRRGKSSRNIDRINNIYNYEDIYNINPDFCIISNPTDAHYSTIKTIFEFKIPLFIEKPLFSNIGLDEKSLVLDIKKSDVPNYVACNLRFYNCLIYSEEFIKKKRINEVNVYCGSYLPDWRPDQDFRKVYSANIEMGGGVHIDLIHELDYVVWHYGYPVKTHRQTSNKSSLGITAVDYANFLLEYNEFNVNIVLNYYRRDAKRFMEVVCEDGTLMVNLLDNKVLWNDEVVYESSKSMQDTYFEQINFYVNNILTQKAFSNDVKEAYEILKICIAND